MKKFTVTLEERVIYEVEVEAETEEQAEKDAVEIWAKSPDPTHDFCGAGQGVDVVRVDEVDNEAAS
jgi:hypothetical protein